MYIRITLIRIVLPQTVLPSKCDRGEGQGVSTALSAESAKVSTKGPQGKSCIQHYFANANVMRDSSSMCKNRGFISTCKTRRVTRYLEHVQNAHHVRRANGAAVVLRAQLEAIARSPKQRQGCSGRRRLRDELFQLGESIFVLKNERKKRG